MEPREQVYRERFMRHLRRFFKPGMKVLDAGCGSGDMAVLISELGCQVVGLDVNPYDIWSKRTSDQLTFQAGSSEAMPFADSSFDALISMDALHHMAWPEKALAEAVRVVKPQAPVIIIETNRLNPITYLRMTMVAKHETFTPKKFFAMIRDCEKDFQARMIESRCLPWNNRLLLKVQNWISDIIEVIPICQQWLTYQMAIMQGQGKKVEPRIDETEPMSKREARIASEVVA